MSQAKVVTGAKINGMDDEETRTALAGWLTEQLAPTATATVHDVKVGPLQRPGVGQSNDTLIFTASWQEGGSPRSQQLVLRRQPTANQLFLNADVIREARVLEGLERKSQAPVPHVCWTEPESAVLGAPFFVMTHVEGTVPAGKPSIHQVGWLPTLQPQQRRALWESAMTTLAHVHATPWRDSHRFLADHDPAADPLKRHLRDMREWYSWATDGRNFAITDAALDYLEAHRPPLDPQQAVLVWGDARIGNMIFGDDCQVAAALDWELATIGPAEIDVGHWLLFDEFATTGAGAFRLPGFPDRTTTVAHYEAITGRRLEHLEYFEILQGFMLATTLIRQADLRVQDGQLPATTRMAHDNAVTQILARHLGLPVPELAPDYLAHRQANPASTSRK